MLSLLGVARASPSDITVTYKHDPAQYSYSFGACLPFHQGDNDMSSLQFNSAAKCYGYGDERCQDLDTSVAPVIFSDGVDFATFSKLGQSAICNKQLL
jgi:hypothetical protein